MVPDRSAGTMLVRETSVDAAVKNIEKSTSSSFAKHSLTLTKENSICVDGTCPTVRRDVSFNRVLQRVLFHTINFQGLIRNEICICNTIK